MYETKLKKTTTSKPKLSIVSNYLKLCAFIAIDNRQTAGRIRSF